MSDNIMNIFALKVNPKLTMGNRGAESDWPYQGAIDVAASFGANMQTKVSCTRWLKKKELSFRAFLFKF